MPPKFLISRPGVHVHPLALPGDAYMRPNSCFEIKIRTNCVQFKFTHSKMT